MNSLSKRGDGPEYHDMDDDAEGECAASWEDMLKIVAEHGVKADYDGATFTRWFGNTGAPSGLLGTIQRSDHKRKIKNVYQNMVKDDGEAKDVWEDIKVQGKDYAKMDDGNTNAYTSPSKGTMHFTKQFYDFDHSDDANCNEVGNIVSWKMQLQEGIWIHEATHYNKIGKAA